MDYPCIYIKPSKLYNPISSMNAKVKQIKWFFNEDSIHRIKRLKLGYAMEFIIVELVSRGYEVLVPHDVKCEKVHFVQVGFKVDKVVIMDGVAVRRDVSIILSRYK
jgi:hypothetical protein